MIVTIVGSQVVEAVLRANLMIGAAILLVLALRRIVRRLFGAEIAYALWLVAPLAALGALAPARTRIVAAALATTTPQTQATGPLADLLHAASHYALAPNLWLAGATLAAAALLWDQLRFLRRERAGRAGPAVVGVISPRFVTPADYATRFTAEERQIIRAHEHTHLSRGDAQANAVIAAVQVLCWFNPLVHLAARLARHDQELACDASVLRRLPVTRRRYAETLLKTQLGAAALPLGCHWPAPARHPLEERIEMLGRTAPGTRRRLAGRLAVVAVALAAGGGVWLAKPVHGIAAPIAAAARAPDHTMLFLIYRHGAGPASPAA